MKIGDINFEDGTVLIPCGKGDKSRELAMPPECLIAFRTWAAEHQKLKCEHDHFWAYGPKRGMSADKMREMLEQIKAIAGFKDAANIKPHSLRHYFATNMLRNGATVKQIQVALGHTNLKQTATYLHLDEQDAKAMAVYASFVTETEEAEESTQTIEQSSKSKLQRKLSLQQPARASQVVLIGPSLPTKTAPARRFRKVRRSRAIVH